MKRILLVDDDPGIREALMMVFDPQHYEVSVYANGSQVLNNQFEIPDLFILDKQLSGVDGLDICRFLKSQPATSHIPVIMLSASPGIYRLAQTAGANDALEKPFALKTLRVLVNKHLDYFP